ncbi:MAG: hypothetical protein J6S14_00325 [Clostridia bacterium]|nr:hypothetical protein [Clostridia bacterium]
MAKLVTKFRFYKPKSDQNRGGYAKYIAIRGGVEQCKNSDIFVPPTKKQEDLIAKILKDFPDSKEMLEYEDYTANPNSQNASEFISRAIEDNAHITLSDTTYADYIATRPGVEKITSHGLFSNDEFEKVVLSKVSEKLNRHEGNIWTMIVSLRREDAERLAYHSADAWRILLRNHTADLAEALKIPFCDLKWYAAFHNESHHPHIHLLAYTEDPTIGFLTQKEIYKMRSVLGQDIFKDDLEHIYVSQTERRNELKKEWRKLIDEIIQQMNQNTYSNPEIEQKLLFLSERLSKTKAKKVYGYLKKDLKDVIDSIVDLLAEQEQIAALYDLWWQNKYEILKLYTSEMPSKIPLSQNKEFKSIKNDIIREAMRIHQEREEIINVFPLIASEEEKKEDHSEKTTADERSFQSSVSREEHLKKISASAVTSLMKGLANTIRNKSVADQDKQLPRTDKRLLREIEEKKNAMLQQY